MQANNKEEALNLLATTLKEFGLTFITNYKDFTDDEDVMYQAVLIEPKDIKLASRRLKNNKEFIIKTIENNPYQNSYHLEYVAKRFKNDPDIAQAAFQSGGFVLEYFSENIRNNRELALLATQSNGWAIRTLKDEFKNDPEFAQASFKTVGYALEYFSPKIRNNKELVLLALKNNPRAIQFASQEIIDLCNNEHNPIATLESIIHYENLKKNITNVHQTPPQKDTPHKTLPKTKI